MSVFLVTADLADFFDSAEVVTNTSTTFAIHDFFDGITEDLTLTGTFGGYNGGDYPTTGTITGGTYSISNGASFTFTDISISVEAFTAYVMENDTVGLFQDILDGNDTIVGSSQDDVLFGFDGNDTLQGGAGNDTLYADSGSDTLTGGAGMDRFDGLAADLNGDTITDFAIGDTLVISDANLANFTYSLSGSTLTYSGGSLTLNGAAGGTLVATAAAGGGVQLTLDDTPPPPPPPPPVVRAKLLLTESGQDFIVGGNVAVSGTTAGGEVIEIVRGNVSLDASFNAGGDTVVLPDAAGSYTAVLSGSFVTISGGGLSVSIPVGLAGIDVQFADSTRVLEIEGGQVVLGSQQVTSTVQPVAESGPPLTDPAETGPDSLAKLVLTASGQDVDIGGNVVVTGTAAGGEVITVLGGEVRLDASFNIGGDTVVLAGDTGEYTASRSGSFVTITDGETSVAIPVGLAGLTVDFADADLVLRYDTASGSVMLGDQAVTTTPSTVQAAAALDLDKDMDADALFAAAPRVDLAIADHGLDLHRLELGDGFSFA